MSHVGEAGNTGEVVHDLDDEVASLEEALLQMGASSKMSFHFAQCGRSPSEWSSLPEHQQSKPAQEDQTHYCIWVRVTLGEGGGDQPQHPHTWTSLLIADMFQDGLEELITEAVASALGRWSYFLEDSSLKRAPSWWCKGCWIPLGPGEKLRWKWQCVLCRKAIKPLQTLSWERELRPGDQDAPGNNEDKLDPCSSLQHQRVDVRLRGRCFWSGGEKWWSE